jgi:Probable zinc-ribbon domain
MTSKETKRGRLQESQLKRAKALAGIDTCDPNTEPPPGAVIADQGALAHNNTYGRLPRFYLDKVVVCRQCSTEEVWPAERQKWWYELAKGNINTDAVLCRSCRERERTRKKEARRVHLNGLAKKHGKNEA